MSADPDRAATYHLPLGGIGEGDRRRVGGKAAACARLLRRGYAVPRGFAVTADAFFAFLAHAGLERAIPDLIEGIHRGGVEAISERAGALRERATRSGLPDAVRREVAAAARGLRSPFAVRSSAAAEDGAEASFAGVYRTELRVAAGDLEAAIARGFAAALDPAAIAYALRWNKDPRALPVSLLVQEMVEADIAGVLFTREPTGRRPDVAVISFTMGTGEALMDGESGGTTIEVDRGSGDVVEGDGAALGAARTRQLLALGARIEAEEDHPQDIEWAFRGAELSILQARPITTLEPLSEPEIVWSRELSEERYPKPISPLGWSVIRPLLGVNLRTLARRFGLVARRPDHVARTIDHHVYANETFFRVPGSLRPNPFAQLPYLGGYLVDLVRALVMLPAAALLGRGAGVKWLAASRLFHAAIAPHAREIRTAWPGHLARCLEAMDAIAARRDALPALSDRELLAARREMDAVAARYMEPDLAIYVVKMGAKALVGALAGLATDTDPAELLPDLTAGLDANRTLIMSEELEALAVRFAASREASEHLRASRFGELLRDLEPALRAELDAFLERSGHTTTSWDLREPTWGEAPEHVLALLRGYVLAPDRRSVGDRLGDQRARFEAARDRVAHGLVRRFPWLRGSFVHALRTLHDFMRIDEEHHFYCSRLFPPYRALLQELGRRLAARGATQAPDDAFFLSIEEAEAALAEPAPFTRRLVIDARRHELERSLAVRPPDRVRGRAPIAPDGAAVGPDEEGLLRGRGASPGVAIGCVRIVESPSDLAALQPGDVMVTVSPNPAWTPVYAVASALVTATGSVLSHGFVSAREYRLPAVTGIPDVTRRLRGGERVKVDGDRGTVSSVPPG